MKDKFAQIEQYNVWGGAELDLGFSRKHYTSKIMDYSGNKLIKVLTGQRRVGKSYILMQIMDKLIKEGVNPKNTLYVNTEFTDFDFVRHYTELEKLLKLYKERVKPEGKVWLFIDEIQNIEGWEHFANSYSQNFAQKYELYISGSNSKMLSGELATLLSGRYINFEIFPFSFDEYLGITKREGNLKHNYMDYLESGALPELFILPNEETKRNYISAIKDTVLLRDIIQRYNVKDPQLLDDLFTYLVNKASNIISINNIVKFFKGKNRSTTYDTVANYISYIEDSFLIHKAERFDIKGKDTLSGTCKYYINDLSFKNYLYSGFGYGQGYMFENLIYLQLRTAGYNVYVGMMRNGEVDFVAKKGREVIYVQVAYTIADEETARREYASLLSISDNHRKIVVSLDDFKLQDNEGILHLKPWELEGVLAYSL
ncbi:MAG: ATP-binding protein [Bacteroidales bacterium]